MCRTLLQATSVPEKRRKRVGEVSSEVSSTRSTGSKSSLEFNSDRDLPNIVVDGTLGITDVDISVGSSAPISGIINEDGVPNCCLLYTSDAADD